MTMRTTEADLVKDSEGLASVLHALDDGLALLSDVDKLADHLVEADVAVQVVVDGVEGLVGLVPVGGPEHLVEVFGIEGVLALGDKGHPDAPAEGLGGQALLEGFEVDGVSRGGVKDLLASDLLGKVAKDRGDLVAEAADVSDDLNGGGGAAAQAILLLPQGHLDAVVDVVPFGELGAVHGEEGARGVVEHTEQVDLALGGLDAVGKGVLVVRDTNQLDGLFGEDGRRDEKGAEDALQDDPADFGGAEGLEEVLEGEIRGHGEEEGDGDGQVAEDGGVLADAHADDAAEGESLGQEPGGNLGGPEGEPGDLDPEEKVEEKRSLDGRTRVVFGSAADGEIGLVAGGGEDDKGSG